MKPSVPLLLATVMLSGDIPAAEMDVNMNH